MTYGGFLGVFVVVPVVLLVAWLAWRGQLDRRLGFAIAITAVIAVAYTTPWDNLLVAQGVWGYPPERVLGITIGLVPLEEYAFFVLQTLFVGLLVRAVAGWRGRP